MRGNMSTHNHDSKINKFGLYDNLPFITDDLATIKAFLNSDLIVFKNENITKVRVILNLSRFTDTSSSI